MRYLPVITAVITLAVMPIGGFAAQRAAGAAAGEARLAQLCSAGSHDIPGLPIDQLQRIAGADEAKKGALDELVKAATKVSQDISAACPAEVPPTVPDRLAAMQKRIESMSAAVATVRGPLEKFYGLLSDEEKEQVVSLGERARQGRPGSLLDQDCGSAQATPWPSANIERTVHPTDAQRPSLATLQDAAAKAADMSKALCAPENFLTPTARLAAVGKRLDTLLAAIKTVDAPLNDFYATLDEEQKARFNGISLPQTAQVEQPKPKPTVVHRHHFVSLGYLIRRLLHSF
jgi:hypothetical protein